MASFPCSALSACHLHPKPSNLGFRNDHIRTLISTKSSPHLHKAIPFSSKTVASDQVISPFPKISCSRTPQIPQNAHKNPTLLRRVAEGAAVLLVGSLLFLGRFGIRPALALDDAPRSNTSAPLEEKIDAVEEDEVEMYAKVLEKNPKDVEALKIVLYGKLKKGKMKEAAEFIQRLTNLEPDNVEWRLLQALCYEQMGELDMAKKLFKDILKERPLLIRALHGLALAMYKSHESAAAFEMLYKALELAHCEKRVTEVRNVKLLIAQMYVVKGDLDGASLHFQRLIKEDPRDFRPYLCLGIIYSLLDREKEAEEQFEIYQSLVPEELPQGSFIDDVILSAKTESHQFEKEVKSEYSPTK